MKNYFKALQTSPNPITLQCTYSDSNNVSEFSALLNQLSHYGFYGIELNLPDLQILPSKELDSLLLTYKLKLTYIATGAFAKSRGLSLSCNDPGLRKKSIEGCRENIRYAGELGAGVIIGFLKNHPGPDQEHAALYLEESLMQLDTFASELNVPILLEATNHYESCVANSLYDTQKILDAVGGRMTSLLPDTYHMNMEESRPLEALDFYQGYYQNIHLSDNNRLFPGLGCLTFENYLSKLNQIHYQGTFGIEGNLKNGITEDLEVCVEYLNRVIASVTRFPG